MNSRTRIVIIIVVAVLLLAGGAFAAGRLLNQGLAGPQGLMGLLRGGGGPMQVSVKLNLIPAKELPVEEPTMRGLLSKRDTDTLYLGQGKQGAMIAVSKGGSGEAPSLSSPQIEGPLTEVVVTHDTKIYKDVTFNDAPKEPVAAGEQTLQQKVEIATLDELGQNTAVTVWGKKVGDRIVADVLVYSNLVVFRSGK
ncbi:MAG TPA: hypothetical protein VMT46_14520 [Anaerolineaceae bacterium]|nr:hypothetical protein [Anaerolineaceae bacterium]